MMRRSTSALAAVLLLPALAACSPVMSSPTRSATASSPSPSVTVASAPRFAFDIGCAGLLHQDEAQAALSVPIHEVVDEAHPRVEDLPLAQARGITCVWGGVDRTDGGYDDSVTISVLPNASAEFAVWKPHQNAHHCDAVNGACDTEVLVRDAWVDLLVSGRTTRPLDETSARLVQLISPRLAAAAPTASTWAPPANALRGPSDCAALVSAADTIVGVTTLRVQEDAPDSGTPADQAAVTGSRVDETGCGWANADYSSSLGWTVLVGGGWAFSRLDEPQLGNVATHAASVAGADGAWIGCADGCVAVLELRGSLVTMSTDYGLDDATLTARAAASIRAFAEG